MAAAALSGHSCMAVKIQMPFVFQMKNRFGIDFRHIFDYQWLISVGTLKLNDVEVVTLGGKTTEGLFPKDGTIPVCFYWSEFPIVFAP